MGVVARRSARTVGLLLLLPAVSGGLLALGLAAIASSASFSIGSLERPHLKPIAIPARSCPSLRAVRVTADTANGVWETWLGARNMTPASDARAKVALGPRLDALELSLRVAALDAPAPLRATLADTARQVDVGRVDLRTSPDFGTFFGKSMTPLTNGLASLRDSSDLVGGACGFSLVGPQVPTF